MTLVWGDKNNHCDAEPSRLSGTQGWLRGRGDFVVPIQALCGRPMRFLLRPLRSGLADRPEALGSKLFSTFRDPQPELHPVRT